MIATIQYPDSAQLAEILRRPFEKNDPVSPAVQEILNRVKNEGDAAVRHFNEKFSGSQQIQFEIAREKWSKVEATMEPALKAAIDVAIANIRKFHQQQIQDITRVATSEGVVCWRKSVGIEKVGLYIPGGSAPLFSTLLMLAIPATIAGCKDIIVCTPADANGNVHAAILYAAKATGVSRIFGIGGAQAIAAMGYGTETVPRVYKLFGPGNSYVTTAKMLLSASGIAIDMPAGPSEVAVIADSSCVPSFVAADLLAQAEHGPDSQVILVSNNSDVIEKVNAAVEEQLAALPRKQIATEALRNSKAIQVHTLQEGIDLLNNYAPEHLIIATANADELADKVLNAGSVFIGNYTPESAGDYASGTNHTLPTGGHSKAYSGVSVDSFQKKITFQKISRSGIEKLGATIEQMAIAEGLQAHANSITIRTSK